MTPRQTHTVGILALGPVTEIVLKIVAAHVSGYLELPTCFLPQMALPPECLDERRGQYDAARLINCLNGRSFAGCTKVLALLDADLFVPIFTHIFGEAQQGGSHAVISLFRLQYMENGAKSTDADFYERAAKVALHELGHLLDLFHCPDSACIMHFSGTIETLDTISMGFCPYCQSYLKQAGLKIEPAHTPF
ncbi:MAG: zinc metallopeptidase [Desulfobacterales bacterium]